MIQRLVPFLLGLSPRERGLLAALCGIVLPLAVVFLGILPLRDAHRAGQQDLRTAENLAVWVAERSAENAALQALEPEKEPQSSGAIGISGIEKSLQDSDLRSLVTRLSARDGGGVDLALEGVEFQVLSTWLDATVRSWGYALQSFRFDATDTPGMVNAEFQLEVAE